MDHVDIDTDIHIHIYTCVSIIGYKTLEYGSRTIYADSSSFLGFEVGGWKHSDFLDVYCIPERTLNIEIGFHSSEVQGVTKARPHTVGALF